jgi:DNA-binding NtrC family response regulator
MDTAMSSILIGKSKALKNIIRQINTLAVKNDDLLIIGEQGSGKKAAAEAIHAARFRGNEVVPLVIIKPAEYDDKELNHMFDQYHQNVQEIINIFRKDYLSFTQGGTVIIDEIDSASYKKQVAILNFIGRLTKLRSDFPDMQSIVRIVVTIKTDPLKLAYKKQLNLELANYLVRFTRFRVPPLRDRKEDIPYLVEYFISEVYKKLGAPVPVLDINTLSILVKHPWKHNIRELKMVIDRAVLFSTNGMVSLPREIVDETDTVTEMLVTIFSARDREKGESPDYIERSLLDSTLKRFNFNISKTAEFLGLHTQKLRDRVNQLGLVRVSK